MTHHLPRAADAPRRLSRRRDSGQLARDGGRAQRPATPDQLVHGRVRAPLRRQATTQLGGADDPAHEHGREPQAGEEAVGLTALRGDVADDDVGAGALREADDGAEERARHPVPAGRGVDVELLDGDLGRRAQAERVLGRDDVADGASVEPGDVGCTSGRDRASSSRPSLANRAATSGVTPESTREASHIARDLATSSLTDRGHLDSATRSSCLDRPWLESLRLGSLHRKPRSIVNAIVESRSCATSIPRSRHAHQRRGRRHRRAPRDGHRSPAARADPRRRHRLPWTRHHPRRRPVRA